MFLLFKFHYYVHNNIIYDSSHSQKMFDEYRYFIFNKMANETVLKMIEIDSMQRCA